MLDLKVEIASSASEMSTSIQQYQIVELDAGIAVFVGGFAFGRWVTNSDPAFLSILAKSERYKPRYDAAKQPTRSRTVSQEPIFRRWHGSGKAPATEIPVNAENVDLSLASSGGDLQCHHSFYRR